MIREACDVFDKLPDLENAFSKEPKMSLYYIAGYIIRKVGGNIDDLLLNDTNFYQHKYVDFV